MFNLRHNHENVTRGLLFETITFILTLVNENVTANDTDNVLTNFLQEGFI